MYDEGKLFSFLFVDSTKTKQKKKMMCVDLMARNNETKRMIPAQADQKLKHFDSKVVFEHFNQRNCFRR
jgi:hypothetical protein